MKNCAIFIALIAREMSAILSLLFLHHLPWNSIMCIVIWFTTSLKFTLFSAFSCQWLFFWLPYLHSHFTPSFRVLINNCFFLFLSKIASVASFLLLILFLKLFIQVCVFFFLFLRSIFFFFIIQIVFVVNNQNNIFQKYSWWKKGGEGEGRTRNEFCLFLLLFFTARNFHQRESYLLFLLHCVASYFSSSFWFLLFFIFSFFRFLIQQRRDCFVVLIQTKWKKKKQIFPAPLFLFLHSQAFVL